MANVIGSQIEDLQWAPCETWSSPLVSVWHNADDFTDTSWAEVVKKLFFTYFTSKASIKLNSSPFICTLISPFHCYTKGAWETHFASSPAIIMMGESPVCLSWNKELPVITMVSHGLYPVIFFRFLCKIVFFFRTETDTRFIPEYAHRTITFTWINSERQTQW